MDVAPAAALALALVAPSVAMATFTGVDDATVRGACADRVAAYADAGTAAEEARDNSSTARSQHGNSTGYDGSGSSNTTGYGSSGTDDGASSDNTAGDGSSGSSSSDDGSSPGSDSSSSDGSNADTSQEPERRSSTSGTSRNRTGYGASGRSGNVTGYGPSHRSRNVTGYDRGVNVTTYHPDPKSSNEDEPAEDPGTAPTGPDASQSPNDEVDPGAQRVQRMREAIRQRTASASDAGNPLTRLLSGPPAVHGNRTGSPTVDLLHAIVAFAGGAADASTTLTPADAGNGSTPAGTPVPPSDVGLAGGTCLHVLNEDPGACTTPHVVAGDPVTVRCPAS